MSNETAKPQQVKISRKLLLPTAAIIAAITIMFITYVLVTNVQRSALENTRELTQLKSIIENDLDDLQSMALGFATEMATNPQVQAAFAAQDRELLTQLTMPTYEKISQDFAVKQFQFIVPPATSFLRLHQPDKFGDDLSTFRFTVLQANSTKQPVGGIEIGRGGLGVRGEVPVYHDGQYVGIVDVGLDIGPAFLEKIKQLYNADVQVMLETKAAETATFESLTKGPTDELQYQAGTMKEPIFTDVATYARVLSGETVFSNLDLNDKKYAIVSFPVHDYSGTVIGVFEVVFDHTDVIAAQNRTLFFITLISLLIAVVGSYFIVRLVNRTIQPIESLTRSAAALARGDFGHKVEIRSNDELGNLADAFNSMASQLQATVSTLEQQVHARTKALAASSEVSRRLSTILNQQQLVSEVVNQVNNAFGYYHTQIYFFDANNENLVMSGGTGEAGKLMLAQYHKVRKGNGLVGRAAASNQVVLVPETAKNSEWLPNHLLPDTKAEIAIPIAIGDEVLGVLDVQHNVPNGLTPEEVDALVSIANQVAVATQNARTYTEIQRNQSQLAEALQISRLGNWEYDVEHDLFTFNEQFYSVFRTTIEKVGSYKLSSGDYARLFVHPEDAPLVGGEIQGAMMSKDRHYSKMLEHRIIFADGEIGYISVRFTVERDENGKIIRFYGANQDITERRRLEEINRKRAFQQETINTVTQRIQGATNVETALKIAARELGQVLGGRQTVVSLDRDSLSSDAKVTTHE